MCCSWLWIITLKNARFQHFACNTVDDDISLAGISLNERWRYTLENWYCSWHTVSRFVLFGIVFHIHRLPVFKTIDCRSQGHGLKARAWTELFQFILLLLSWFDWNSVEKDIKLPYQYKSVLSYNALNCMKTGSLQWCFEFLHLNTVWRTEIELFKSEQTGFDSLYYLCKLLKSRWNVSS